MKMNGKLFDGKITQGISTASIDKNKCNWGAVSYTNETMNLLSFEANLKSGRAFCGAFRHDGYSYRGNQKAEKFKSTNVVSIDFDDDKITYENALKTAENNGITPTIAYCTTNHIDGEDGRFRFLYCFQEAITSPQHYKSIYNKVRGELLSVLNLPKLSDDCGARPTQQMAGNGNPNAHFYNSLIAYELPEYHEEQPIEKRSATGTTARKGQKTLTYKQAKRLLNEQSKNHTMLKMLREGEEYISIYEQFKHIYKVFDSTDCRKEIARAKMRGDLWYELPMDYIEIRRKFECVTNAYGNLQRVLHRWQDGEQRRKKLYLNLIVRRMIFPSASIDMVMFWAVRELAFYFDADDIQRWNIENIVANAYVADIESDEMQDLRVKYIASSSTKTGMKTMSRKECEMQGTTRKEAAYLMRKAATRAKHIDIANIVSDWAMTYKDIQLELQEQGVEVSQRTLKKIYKEIVAPLAMQGGDKTSHFETESAELVIRKKEKKHYCQLCTFDETKMTRPNDSNTMTKKQRTAAAIAKYYDATKTDKENIQTLAANGVKCGISTLTRWKRERKNNKNVAV